MGNIERRALITGAMAGVIAFVDGLAHIPFGSRTAAAGYAGPRSQLAEPPGALHRAARARRRIGLRRPRDRRGHVASHRPAGRDREPDGCRRHHRHRDGDQERAGRLFGPRDKRQRRERPICPEAHQRLSQGPRSGHPAGAPAARAGGTSRARRELGRGIGPGGKGAAGTGLCDLGRRLEPARAAGMVRADGRHQARPRALSRRRAGDQRPHCRPRPRRIPRADRADPALQGRRVANARPIGRGALAKPAGGPDPARRGLQGAGTRDLVRGIRAGRDAAVDHRSPQCGDRQGAR